VVGWSACLHVVAKNIPLSFYKFLLTVFTDFNDSITIRTINDQRTYVE